MKNTLETRLGIFFALALIVAVLVLEMVGAFGFLKGGITIQASFNNVQELKLGDLVKMAGVEIGRVEEIGLTRTNVALVHMRILSKYRNAIHTDAIASIKTTGLMGQNFIGIEGGSSTNKVVEPDALLQTTEPADLNALIAKANDALEDVRGAARSLSSENLSTILGPLRDFVTKNSPVLTTVFANAKTVSDDIAQGKGTVGKLVKSDEFYQAAYGAATNLQAASTDLKQLMQEADGMMQDTRRIIARINAGEGTVGRLINDDVLFVQTTNAMANLSEILQKINRGYGTVGKLVNDETLYRNAKLSLQKVEKATEGLEDQGPLSVLGIAVSTLF